jgi:TonB dependent receptor-like, beta-barrel
MDWSSQWAGTGDPGWVPNTLGRLTNNYQLNEALTLLKGRHNLKLGISYNYLQARVKNSQNDPRGQLHINGQYAGSGTPGSELADWLTGALNEVDRDEFFTTPNTRTKFFGVFGQDDFRLNNKVTLNLGLRYDVYTPSVDTNNQQSNFVTAGAGAGMIQVASASNRSPNMSTYKRNIAPRLGIAYTPDNGRTAYRAAFGLSYFNDNFGAIGGTLERNYPELLQDNNVAPQQSCSSTVNPTTTYSGCGSYILANGLPGIAPGTPGVTPGVFYQPLIMPSVARGGFVAPPPGFGVYQVASNFRQDQAEFWNVSIERALSSTMSLHAAYVGTAGNHLYHDYQLNQCVPTTYGTPGLPFTTFITNLEATTNTTSVGAACQAAGIGFPYYNVAPNISTLDFRNSGGKSHYNAGQFELLKRTSFGLAFTAAYTWSKMMDNINNPIDSYAMNEELDTANWQRNNFPRVLTITYSYALPFGRNMQFANSISPLADEIVGGWSLSGITNFRSGAPLIISAPGGQLGPHGASQRANYLCTSQINPHTTSDWFDRSCFSEPIGFTLGNSGVGKVFGPPYQDWDMALNKAFRLTERAHLQFQANFFNVFNHTNFQNPDTNVQDGSNFGSIHGEYLPRQGQLGMVLSF